MCGGQISFVEGIFFYLYVGGGDGWNTDVYT